MSEHDGHRYDVDGFCMVHGLACSAAHMTFTPSAAIVMAPEQFRNLHVQPPHERIARLEREVAATREWTCPECAFSFNAEHRDEITGGYTCPLCEVETLTQAADTLRRAVLWYHGESREGHSMYCVGCAALSSWDALKEAK